jgi:uncharacterized paraquat-inducible protein A
MAAPVKCAKGHWYTPDPSGKATTCPRCAAQAQQKNGTPISDDDVLAFLDDPPQAAQSPGSSSQKLPSEESHHSLQRRKKVCPACHFETSVSFGHCPRCGGPLEVARVDVI